MQIISENQFFIKRSELTTEKLFVEFYLPEYQRLLTQLRQSPYPLEPLRHICKRMFDGPFGSNRKVDMYQDDGIPYVRVKDVSPGEIIKEDLTYISLEKHAELSRSRVVPGNVLLTIAGRVGTAAVFPTDLMEGNITGHIAGIEFPEHINPDYAALFLNSRFGQFQIARLAHRTTRPELNLKEVGQVLVTLPPRSIQDRIAQIMQDAYTERRSKLVEAYSLSNGIDEYILNELGSKLEALSDNKYFLVNVAKLRGGRFDVGPYANKFKIQSNGAWVSLCDVAHLPRQARTASNTPDTEFDYIGMSDVDDITGEVNIQRLLGSQIQANKTVFGGNDVVFARIEPCIYNRKIALIPPEIGEALGSTELLVARARKEMILPEFLLWMLRSELIQRQIAGHMTGTTGRRRLPSQAFANLKMPKVSLDQQRKIANEVSKYRTQAKRLQTDAEELVFKAKQQIERMILGEDIDP